MSEEIEKLEAQKAAVQQQAVFELGRLQGRIELLKEQAAKVAVPVPPSRLPESDTENG